MTEINNNGNSLEQRLRKHYQQHYAPSPAPRIIWARVQSDLDKQARNTLQSPQRPQWLSTPADLLGAGRQGLSRQRREKATLMESAINSEQVDADYPRSAQRKKPLRRYLRHTLETAIAVLLVLSLLLGWLAVTRWRSTQQNTQGNGAALFTYVSQPGEVGYDSHWTPDGKHLVFALYTIATNQYRYQVWDVASGKARQTLEIKLPASVSGRGMLDSSDGHYALIRTNGATPQDWVLKLANLLTGQTRPIYQGTYQGQNASDLPSAAFSGDGKYLAFIGTDERIYIWDIAASNILQITDSLIETGTARVKQFTWSVDNKRLMAESAPPGLTNPARLQIWSAQTGHTLLNFVATPAISLVTSFSGPGSGFAGLSPDGTRLLTYNQHTGVLTERESSSLQILQTLAVKVGLPNSGGYVVFWQAGGTRIVWQNNRSVAAWNAGTGKLVLALSSEPSLAQLLVPSSGRHITRGQPGNLLEIWDVVTGTKVRTLALAHLKPLWAIWSPDDTYLDLNDSNRNGAIVNALSGKPVTHYQGDGALLSPDHQLLAVQINLSVSLAGNGQRQVMVQIVPVRA